MPNRLTKIVTRGGDKGETSLGDGTRLAKDHPRIALLGDVDELNSWIGVVLAHLSDGAVAKTLISVQHDLFDLGGALSLPGAALLSAAHVERIDAAAAALNEGLAPLKEFILPGGAPILAWLHVARTVCRRAERALAGLAREQPEVAQALRYLNRLSDYLFIATRFEARRLGVAETLWTKQHSISGADAAGEAE
ncbi:MAG: cob(I)yrinic acid a,c-diamide adenosyltransferase [Alphaproteobacteria bacterium]|nr:cob(I)yrinic acid a,c-diamide adenosyltransferase [Alphaproteobacteria bacterium]